MSTCHLYEENYCRSCQLIGKEYQLGLKEKVNHWRSLLEIDSNLIEEVFYPKEPLGGRNKAKIMVGGCVESPLFGFPDPESFKKVRPLENCPLYLQGMNDIYPVLRELVRSYQLTPYNVELKKGELKYVIFYQSESTNEKYLKFILRSKEALDRLKKALPFLKEKISQLKVVSASLQPKHKAILEGEEEIFLTDSTRVNNRINELELPISTRSFFQVTSEVASKLYLSVQDRMSECDHALDLFCGVGGFSFHLAKKAKKVFGVELSKDAIECAKDAVKKNNLSHIDFLAKDAYEFLKEQRPKIDTLVVNPPRRGLGEKICRLVEEFEANEIFYSSCNPETLNKDLLLLNKYEVIWARPFDMFPYTNHLEFLVHLKRIRG